MVAEIFTGVVVFIPCKSNAITCLSSVLSLGDTVNLAFVTAEARTPVSESIFDTALAISRADIPVLNCTSDEPTCP